MNLVHQLRNLIWGPWLIIFILGTGLFMTCRLRGLQFRRLPSALKMVFFPPKHGGTGDISPFQSLMTALAATIGIGSIAGVATALTAGGLGSLFWMVIAALVGMATVYSEAYLAVQFRTKDANGQIVGGPMVTIARGLKWKWLAALFAIAGAIAAITTGNMIQANAIADVLLMMMVPRWATGIGVAILVGAVLIGGIRGIGRVASFLVPIMALLYIVGGLIAILVNYRAIPGAVAGLFYYAFEPMAPVGGFLGASVFLAIQMGISKGLLASESGLGSQAIAAAAARTDAPGRQALIAMTGAFLSVCVVCLITGLAIIISGVMGEIGPQGLVLNGVPLTIAAYNRLIPSGGGVVVLGSILFGYSTLLGWSYYGEKCIEHLFGIKSVFPYRIIYMLAMIAGAMASLDLVWALADIANAFMIVPNLISVLLLSGLVAKGSRRFLDVVDAEHRLHSHSD